VPLYAYECLSCGDLFEETYKIADRKKPTKRPCYECGGEIVQAITRMNIGDPVRLGVKRPSSEFNHVIEQIAEQNPRSKLYQKHNTAHRKKGM
tara:strand:- start:437 stop:715 length:279 start_codon:yes stop_codon:yes gene_type:complete